MLRNPVTPGDIDQLIFTSRFWRLPLFEHSERIARDMLTEESPTARGPELTPHFGRTWWSAKRARGRLRANTLMACIRSSVRAAGWTRASRFRRVPA